jgi:sec-independent protein translocase protein TatA
MDIGWPEIAIIAVVILVLFGSKKLPDAARSLGKSMRILKTEVKGLHDDDNKPAQPAEISAPQPAAAPPAETVSAGEPNTTTT